MDIEQIDFPNEKYSKEVYKKNQIVIHHTVSNPKKALDPIKYWISQKGRVSTPYVIDVYGNIIQCFDDKYWAHHLGIKKKYFRKYGLIPKNIELNKHSIGIELCNWGYVKKDGERFKTIYNSYVDDDLEIVKYEDKYKDREYYQKYSDEQLASLKELLLYLSDKYNIDKSYNIDMWDVSTLAMDGEEGIWTHTSFREDKYDCHPQKELVDMLDNF